MMDMPRDQRPLSEQFRLVAKRWVEADGAAHLMEEMKTTVLEQKKTAYIAKHGDMPDAKVERIVKSSHEWEVYIKTMCKQRTDANLLKRQMDYINMKHREMISADANARKEMGL